jgi:hypothetical protein
LDSPIGQLTRWVAFLAFGTALHEINRSWRRMKFGTAQYSFLGPAGTQATTALASDERKKIEKGCPNAKIFD